MADRPLLVAVLAAGSASRFGGGKLDALCAGKPLGRWVLEAVAEAGLAPGIIVTGKDPPAFAEGAECWAICINPVASEGQGSSVALAARTAIADGAELLLLLADMPLVPPSHLQALVESQQLAATTYPDGTPGVPIFVPNEKLAPLAELAGGRGAGPFLRQVPDLRCIEAPPGTLSDVDTDADLAEIDTQLLVMRQQAG
ncbi:MAG: NTP transferase domain-containing protein [Erythrobacter sp.]|nr:MAG: NTP transferase domain-containing protein [Erythrobacter sp.]